MAQASIDKLTIAPADFEDGRVLDLLRTHMLVAASETAAESAHVLDLSGLQSPAVRLWTTWDDATLLGCGALKRLSNDHAEIKSMHVAQRHRGRGVGSVLVQHIIAEARKAGHKRLSLQTGSRPFFQPAIRLYQKHGFVPCAPFAPYAEDPNSTYLTQRLLVPSLCRSPHR